MRGRACRRRASDVLENPGQGIIVLAWQLFFEQGEDGILSSLGIQIKHQSKLVISDRLEREDLRGDGLLEIEHNPHDVGLVLRHAQGLDVGVVRTHLAYKLTELSTHVQPLDVHHHSVWVFKREMFGAQFAVKLKRDTGVFLCGPSTNCQQLGGERCGWDDGQNKQGASCAQQFSAG